MSNCTSCAYFNSADSTCHRYAPVVRPPENPMHAAQFPRVGGQCWCGDHSACQANQGGRMPPP
jgi:hypothetical protein